ncbi:protein SanA, affects membrane permeability for vancomycin [Nonomuraea maritima]|uniref:Protein SanA, affects membrane permeability for vancomycin n=1 Tax=Nonomuraea maritima TaxID=683260 RepID=A0A1G9CD41_9ACTN|nr:ElyC/SanA/YdcF family protein [Nonomuraea maritima]SDK49335.1 protein SanA, affects membrane permeability for vancomycin [Nonomuraea maritima]
MRGKVRPSRKTLRRAYQGLVLLSVLALAPMTWAWLGSSPHRVTAEGDRWLAQVPEAQAALVLGAGLYAGHPSPMLARRLDIAAELYHAGKVRALLLSGDNSRKDYDEPTAMRDYLRARGVPASVMVLDYAGFDTWDSCVRARHVFGARRVTVVTQEFHIPRAVTLCRTAGLEAFGAGDDSARRWASTYVYAARELLATGKAFADAVVLRSDPVFAGPPEVSLTRILGQPGAPGA